MSCYSCQLAQKPNRIPLELFICFSLSFLRRLDISLPRDLNRECLTVLVKRHFLVKTQQTKQIKFNEKKRKEEKAILGNHVQSSNQRKKKLVCCRFFFAPGRSERTGPLPGFNWRHVSWWPCLLQQSRSQAVAGRTQEAPISGGKEKCVCVSACVRECATLSKE